MTDDDPITLKDAAELYRLTVSTLRAEAGRGRLEIFRLGKRDYTTILSMREMIEKCRVAARHRASTWTKPVAPGSSATERALSAQGALRRTLQTLQSNLKATSNRNTNRSAGRPR